MKTLKKYLKINTILGLAIVFSLAMVSCEEDDLNNLNDFLKTGGFPKFQAVNPPTAVGVNAIEEVNYSFSVIDGNDNLSSYALSMYADLAGVRTDTVPVSTVNSFPANFSFAAQDFADLLGVTVDDIGFGDNFYFTAVATTQDGLEYSASERLDYDDGDDEDPSTFTLTGGGVTDDLLDEEGYRQAFEFSFVILCPSVDFDALPGTYDVTNLGFAGFFGETDFTREVILGPGANQITIIDGEFPAVGSDDLILTINPNSGAVSLGGGGVAFDAAAGAFATDNYGSATGFVFTCTGNMVLTMDFDAFAGNAHPFELTKQQ